MKRNNMSGADGQEWQAAAEALAARIGVEFNNKALLRQALTHTSFANEMKGSRVLHNERLEFLGDAVLELVTSDYLYRHFSGSPEGELTKYRAGLVCEVSLAQKAAIIELGGCILFGKGELATGGRRRASILADAFEALIGAIYLDQGVDKAAEFILSQLHDDLQLLKQGCVLHDYKTELQELVQKQADCTIGYVLLAEDGPDHAKRFKTAVEINGRQCGTGVGKTKKEAEQLAAQMALAQMKA